jgi:hypothetical protein
VVHLLVVLLVQGCALLYAALRAGTPIEAISTAMCTSFQQWHCVRCAWAQQFLLTVGQEQLLPGSCCTFAVVAQHPILAI